MHHLRLELSKIGIVVVLIAAAIIATRRIHRPEPGSPEYVIDRQATKEFQQFFASHRANLESALESSGFKPFSAGHNASKFLVEADVSQATVNDIRRGAASASVAITGEDPFFRGDTNDIGRMLQFEFVRFRRGAPWYLLTEDGYLYHIALLGRRPDQGFPPEVHVAVKSAFPFALTVDEADTRRQEALR